MEKKRYPEVQMCIRDSHYSGNLYRCIQDLHKFLTCNCLMLIQIFCKFMELSDIVLKDFQCFLVFHPDKLHNLLIKKSLCLKRTA